MTLGALNSFTKTLVCRRTSAASTGAPPTVLPVGANYSVASGFSLVLTENRNCIRRDMAFSSHGTPLYNSKARVGLRVTPPTLRFGVGSFSCTVRRANGSPCQLSEFPESQLSNSFVPEQSRTRSPHVLSHAS